LLASYQSVKLSVICYRQTVHRFIGYGFLTQLTYQARISNYSNIRCVIRVCNWLPGKVLLDTGIQLTDVEE
jgi:hypothetical protein